MISKSSVDSATPNGNLPHESRALKTKRGPARRTGLIAGVVGAWLAVSSCTVVTNGDVVRIRFDNTTADEVTVPVNQGTGATATDVMLLTANDGSAITEPSIAGQGQRANMPDFDDAPGGPRAIVSVTNVDPTSDQLNPGARPFRFGADITLDALNSGGGADDGNNLFQRGLFNDSAQFKLEVDGGRARCRVKGDLGDANVASQVSIVADTPYRIRCIRDGESLTVSVESLDPNDTTVGPITDTVQDTMGPLTYDVPQTPVSIGGKLNSQSGTIVINASDQFNGTIDNALLDIG